MPNPSNVKVQLKTVESIEGYSVPAYPITKWECISVDLPQSRVVTGTTHYVGGIVSSGNSLWFDRSAQQIPTSADVINIGNLRYCPLSNVVNTVTQYANLYVTGATATIVNSNGNAGDGNIPTPEYSVVQAITSPYGSRNIPSEQAVGNALDFKQHILAAGSCIGITAGGVSDTIYVSATRTIAPYGQAIHTQVPTEAAVRDALSATSYNLSNYAYALTDALHTTIINSGYATADWVNSNFIHSGDIVPVDVPYASYGRAGKVNFTAGSGITVVNDEGLVKLSVAGSDTIGGVMIPASGGLSLNATTGALSLGAAGFAASGTAASPALGGVRVVSNGGLLITTAGDSAGNLYLDSARLVDTYNGTSSGTTEQPVGGVRVYKHGGIELSNGNIYLKQAPVISAQDQLYPAIFTSKTLGGVVVVNTMTDDNYASYANSAVVPGMNLFFETTHPAFSVTASKTNRSYGIRPGSVTEDGVLLYTVTANVGKIIEANSDVCVYLHISRSDSSSTWSSYEYTTTLGTEDDTNKYYPIARIISDATKITSITQLQIGNINIRSASGAGLQKFIVTKGTGINITNSGTTKCTVGLSAAQAATLGGVMVPASQGLSLNQTGAISLAEAPIGTDYADAVTSKANGVLGGVVVMQYITSAYDASTSGAVVVPTVDAVYRAISASAGGGGKPVSSGTGISVTDAGGSYTISLDAATANTLGGVQIPVSSGLALSGDGALTLAAATVASLGGVKLKNSISENSPGTGNIIPTESAIVQYVADHAGTGGGYDGPFNVTSVSGTTAATTVKVKGGYLKWLDGNAWISDSAGGTSRWVLNKALYNATTSNWYPETTGSATELYLVGSSGAKAGRKITATSYLATISGTDMATQQVVSHTTSAAGGRYKWQNDASTYWTDADIPGLDTPFYTTSNDTTAVGSVTTFTYGITVGGSVFSKTADTPLETMGWYDDNGGVEYTNKSWPVANTDYTLYNMASKFGYATSAPSLPPAGAFYTVLAQNQSGAIVQQQYGTVWHEHWGNDYKGQFAIQRIALADNAATYVPAKNAYAYKYIIGNGGNIYGCNAFSPKEVKGGSVVTAGVVLGPGAFSYPDQTVGNATKDDGIYIPYGNTGELWLNIFFGPWPQNSFILPGYSKHQDEIWQFVVTTFKLEGILGNTYSVQLGWVTPNGSPQQEHTGAIAIRGRWT